MSSRSTLMAVSDIQELRENVRKKLSTDSAFQLYEKLTLMLTEAQSDSSFKTTKASKHSVKTPAPPPERPYILTTPDQKERILKAVQGHFKHAKNAPTTIRHLVVILEGQDIKIPGKIPGTTLGAIVSNNSAFELCDKKEGLWRLTSKAYRQEAAAAKKTAWTLKHPAAERPTTH